MAQHELYIIICPKLYFNVAYISFSKVYVSVSFSHWYFITQKHYFHSIAF